MTFFGTPIALSDPALYLIAWVTVTAGLVVMASAGYQELALGIAASVVLTVGIVTRGKGLPFAAPATAGSSGQSGFGPAGAAGGGAGGGGGGSW